MNQKELVNQKLVKILTSVNVIETQISQIKIDLDNTFEEVNKIILPLEKEKFNIGNIKSLKVFENINDFKNFSENLFNIKNWTIKANPYKERAEILKKYEYWNKLKNLFDEQELTNRNLNDEQLVSFFDTLSIMYKVLNEINNESIKKEMNIMMEYRIPVPSKPRTDYILSYRNNLLIIEFGKSDSTNQLSNLTTKKTQELAQYKEQLINTLELDNVKINCHACIYLDESTEINQNKNNEIIDQLCKTINRNFIKQKNAFEILRDFE